MDNDISHQDCHFMNMAVEYAKHGFGNTYPNPAVGCVLVDNDEADQTVIGSGFHPKAGYPHAEIFALFEACGHVDSGVSAAKSVVALTSSEKKSESADSQDSKDIMQKVQKLSDTYSNASNGQDELFGEKLHEKNVTAYVTLEPCCHYGKTPPCAATFVKAGVKRVVVGFRDPNPRVDGGGVLVLKDAGICVDLMPIDTTMTIKVMSRDEDLSPSYVSQQCATIVDSFAKRISPRETVDDGLGMTDYDNYMNGAKRSALRSLAGAWKSDGIMKEISWTSSTSIDMSHEKVNLDEAVQLLPLDHRWLEIVDHALWEKELISLKLSNAVKKKKGVKLLGERIGVELGAHVAQVVGHTVLLYRPGFPPKIDLSGQ